MQRQGATLKLRIGYILRLLQQTVEALRNLEMTEQR
jgi:hypothetical protein